MIGSTKLETNVISSSKEVDHDSQAFGQQIFSTLRNLETWDDTLQSHILKDIFHVFNMLYLSMSHTLRKEFGWALHDVIFVSDQEDRMQISAWASHLQPPKTFENLQMMLPAWLWKRCRRVIPPPDVLFPLIKQLFATYGPVRDSSTNVPLFNHYNWKTAQSILELICQGYISDPPGISLYTVVSLDSKTGNLPIYHCLRGTNFTEGGVHTHLLSHLPLSGVSVRHPNACLCDFILQHNLHVCFYSCTPCTLIGICTGNLRVLLSVPIPIPTSTHTRNPQVTSHGSWQVWVSSGVVVTKIHLFNYILNYNYPTLQAGACRHGVHHQ